MKKKPFLWNDSNGGHTVGAATGLHNRYSDKMCDKMGIRRSSLRELSLLAIIAALTEDSKEGAVAWSNGQNYLYYW